MPSTAARHQTFADAYLSTWSATRAAILAGYSERTAASQGSRLLTCVDVQAYIATRLSERIMCADEALARLTDMARSSADEIVGGDGQISLRDAKRRGALGNVRAISQSPLDGIKLELYDARAALVTILKAHGRFTERVEVSSTALDEIRTFLRGDPPAAAPVDGD